MLYILVLVFNNDIRITLDLFESFEECMGSLPYYRELSDNSAERMSELGPKFNEFIIGAKPYVACEISNAPRS